MATCEVQHVTKLCKRREAEINVSSLLMSPLRLLFAMHTLNQLDILAYTKPIGYSCSSQRILSRNALKYHYITGVVTLLEHSDSVFNMPEILTRCMRVISKNYKCMHAFNNLTLQYYLKIILCTG